MALTLLAIETSATACSVALWHDEKITSYHEISPKQQSNLILNSIQTLLSARNIRLDQLNALAYGCGPGSFTGVRLACSIAQGLGFALKLPLIPVSSLAVLAQTAYQLHGWNKIFTLLDARMQQVHAALFTINAQKQVILDQTEQRAIAPQDLILPRDATWYGVGDGWAVYHPHLSHPLIALDKSLLPRADAIIPLACLKYEREEWVLPEQALPFYT